ncbi:MAG: ribosomal RNA small subunit methyltransferase A [Spirochaetes bacterium]|nr:ribosomal RNA small subunit methyltransferase A [Spirochaetota bacterium]
MNTKDIIEITRSNNISPNKKLGQNFLCNSTIVNRITASGGVTKNDDILEIGPGLGDLTESLLKKANSVTAVEIDSGLFRILNEKFKDINNLILIHKDFLKGRIEGNFTKVISNLPYYCSSEILFQLALKYQINDIFVMLQKEMAERIKASPGTKNYGALSVTLGLYYDPEILFKIDKQSFYPQPDVASSFIHLKKKNNTGLDKDETELFHLIVKSAFWGRRKTLRKSLLESPHSDLSREKVINVLIENNMDKDIRGENLTIDDFIKITQMYSGYDAKKH